MATLETVITAAIILGAAAWLVRWLRSNSRGEGGCSCGKCAQECRTKSDPLLKGRES